VLDDRRVNRLALRAQGEIGAEEMKVRLGPDGAVRDLGKEIPPAEAAGESVGIECSRRISAGACSRRSSGACARGPGATSSTRPPFVEMIRSGETCIPWTSATSTAWEIDTAEDLARARSLFGPRP